MSKGEYLGIQCLVETSDGGVNVHPDLMIVDKEYHGVVRNQGEEITVVFVKDSNEVVQIYECT